MFIAFSRSFLSSICFFIWIMITDRKILKIYSIGLAILVLYGVQATFALCFIGYNLSVEYIPISVATDIFDVYAVSDGRSLGYYSLVKNSI